MTHEEVARRVMEVYAERNDPESAHGLEDMLYEDFIVFVKEMAPGPFCSMAAEILKVRDFDYPKWYA